METYSESLGRDYEANDFTYKKQGNLHIFTFPDKASADAFIAQLTGAKLITGVDYSQQTSMRDTLRTNRDSGASLPNRDSVAPVHDAQTPRKR